MRKRDISFSWDRVLAFGTPILALSYLVTAIRSFTQGQPLSATNEILLALVIIYLGILQLYEIKIGATLSTLSGAVFAWLF